MLESLKKSQLEIEFNESDHTYKLKSDAGIQFNGCTTFIGSFFEPFDEVKIATKLVKTHYRYRDYTVESLIDEWHARTNAGTDAHKEIQAYIENQESPTLPKANQGVAWFEEYRERQGPGWNYLSEFFVYDTDARLMGTIDLVAFNETEKKVALLDWKTSRKIDRTSYMGKCGIKPPSAQLMDCNFVHYNLQLSLYKRLFEKSFEVSVENLLLLHLKETECVAMFCKDLGDSVDAMIEYSLSS